MGEDVTERLRIGEGAVGRAETAKRSPGDNRPFWCVGGGRIGPPYSGQQLFREKVRKRATAAQILIARSLTGDGYHQQWGKAPRRDLVGDDRREGVAIPLAVERDQHAAGAMR